MSKVTLFNKIASGTTLGGLKLYLSNTDLVFNQASNVLGTAIIVSLI